MILSGYLLLTKLTSRPVAKIATGLLLINPYILWNIFYTSPKAMGAYFVLLFIAMLMKGQLKTAGLVAGLAYLSHQYVLVYLLGGIVFWKMRFGISWIKAKNLLLLFLVAALTVLPWELWDDVIYGHPSHFIFYPIVQNGATLTNPAATLSSLATFDLGSFAWIKVVNLYRTLFPYTIGLSSIEIQQIYAGSAISGTMSSHPITTALALLYMFTLPGALSLTLTVPIYFALLRKIVKFDSISLAFILTPILLSVALIGYSTLGLADIFLQPMVPIMIGSGVPILFTLRRRTRRVLFLLIISESLFMTWGIMYPAALLFDLRSIQDIFLASIAVALYAALVVTAYIVFDRIPPVTERREPQFVERSDSA
jgi:hypothetical protein